MLMQSSNKLMRDGRGTQNSDVYWNRSTSTLAGLTMDLWAVRVDRSPLCRCSCSEFRRPSKLLAPNYGTRFWNIYLYLFVLASNCLVHYVSSPAFPFRFLPISIFVPWSSRNPSLPIVNTRYMFFKSFQQFPECNFAHQFYFSPFAQSFSCSQIPRPEQVSRPHL